MSDTTLVIIDLNSQASFEFQFFPNEVKTNDRPNWQTQDTTGGTQPLFYANRNPRVTSFSELYFDNTDTNDSLKETLAELKKFLMDEDPDAGVPPALLVTWGDQAERCVVTDFTVEQIFFSDEGNPTRARISLELTEIQEDGEGTGFNDPHYTEDIF